MAGDDVVLDQDGVVRGRRRLFDLVPELAELLGRVGPERLLVTESGILARADVTRMRAAGVHAFLVGEAFMRAPDPGLALRGLFDT